MSKKLNDNTVQNLIKFYPELFVEGDVPKKRKSFDLPVTLADQIDELSQTKKITKSRLTEIAFTLLFEVLETNKR